MLFQQGHTLNVGRKLSKEHKEKIRTWLMNNHPRKGKKFGASNWLRVENPNLYRNLHKWVNRQLGKANICQECNSTSWVEWANISHEYKKDLTDYVSLCRSCHHKADEAYRRNVVMDEEKYKEVANG